MQKVETKKREIAFMFLGMRLFIFFVLWVHSEKNKNTKLVRPLTDYT